MYDRIQLDPKLYELANEELPKKALEELANRCFTIEPSLEEEGGLVFGYPDSDPRIQDVRMLIKIPDGMRQGEFLYYWRMIGEEARSNWDEFQLTIERQIQLSEYLDAADSGEYKDTD